MQRRSPRSGRSTDRVRPETHATEPTPIDPAAVDLAPTIIDLAGLPSPEHFHARSFAHRQAALPPERQYVYASRDRIDEVTDRQRSPRAARSER
jgi:arylsulfatase A-like enzyme